jgi:hypothetical protein
MLVVTEDIYRWYDFYINGHVAFKEFFFFIRPFKFAGKCP